VCESIVKGKRGKKKFMEINWLWISAVNGAVLLALLGIVVGIRRSGNPKWKDQFAQFDDAVRSAEMSNAAYFR
jgi:hypothetical protein